MLRIPSRVLVLYYIRFLIWIEFLAGKLLSPTQQPQLSSSPLLCIVLRGQSVQECLVFDHSAQTIWFHLFTLTLSAVLLGIGVPARPIMPQGTSWLLLLMAGVLLFA
jgi:hypothetical protein